MASPLIALGAVVCSDRQKCESSDFTHDAQRYGTDANQDAPLTAVGIVSRLDVNTVEQRAMGGRYLSAVYTVRPRPGAAGTSVVFAWLLNQVTDMTQTRRWAQLCLPQLTISETLTVVVPFLSHLPWWCVLSSIQGAFGADCSIAGTYRVFLAAHACLLVAHDTSQTTCEQLEDGASLVKQDDGR
jgi:hypothetical protein